MYDWVINTPLVFLGLFIPTANPEDVIKGLWAMMEYIILQPQFATKFASIG